LLLPLQRSTGPSWMKMMWLRTAATTTLHPPSHTTRPPLLILSMTTQVKGSESHPRKLMMLPLQRSAGPLWTKMMRPRTAVTTTLHPPSHTTRPPLLMLLMKTQTWTLSSSFNPRGQSQRRSWGPAMKNQWSQVGSISFLAYSFIYF
jgi:hypothetical protein